MASRGFSTNPSFFFALIFPLLEKEEEEEAENAKRSDMKYVELYVRNRHRASRIVPRII
jgi:hypothetical protein